jgi:Ca2+-binding RTX toxin-like protein
MDIIEINPFNLNSSGVLGLDGTATSSLLTLSNNAIPLTAIAPASINEILGTSGRDVLRGTPESDRIIGGQGADLITGGLGNDIFVYPSIRDAGDTIKDVEVGRDILDFRGVCYAVPSASLMLFLSRTPVQVKVFSSSLVRA